LARTDGLFDFDWSCGSRGGCDEYLWGGAIGLTGLLIRAYAAGYLHKQEVLAMTARMRTRGTIVSGEFGAGAGSGGGDAVVDLRGVLLIYFGCSIRWSCGGENSSCGQRHGAAFDQYAKADAVFFSTIVWRRARAEQQSFLWRSTKKKIREWKAALGFVVVAGYFVGDWRLRLH